MMTTHLACFQNSPVPITKLFSRKTQYRSELQSLEMRLKGKEKKKRRRQRKEVKDEGGEKGRKVSLIWEEKKKS